MQQKKIWREEKNAFVNGWVIEHVCQISGSYLHKTALMFGPLCGKHV